MFLDPDPRTSRRPQSQTEFAGFIPPLSPVAAPADQRIIRKPLLERSPNRSLPKSPSFDSDEPVKSTVRLVRQSPSVASIRKELFGELDARYREKLKSLEESDWKTDDTKAGLGISDNRKSKDEDAVESSVLHTPADTPLQAQEAWQPRNVSDSNFSNATTLAGTGSVSNVSLAYAQSNRLSSGTTLRDISTLQDTTLESLDESLEEAGPLEEDFSYLADTVIHDTPSRSTIRTVSDMSPSSSLPQQSVDTPRPASPAKRLSWSTPDLSEIVQDSPPIVSDYEQSSPEQSQVENTELSLDDSPDFFSSTPERRTDLARPISPQKRLDWTSSPEQSESALNSSPPTNRYSFAPAIPPRVSSKHASVASFSLQRASMAAVPASPETVQQFSPVQSEVSVMTGSAMQSSPNFIAWNSSPNRPRSRSHPLRGEISYESISARLRSDQSPVHAQNLAHSQSYSSLDPTSSLDTLPSIHVPRRRLRQVRGSLSLDSTRRQHAGLDDSIDTTDTMPYQRQVFNGNLSTIASESDRSRSRTVSQQPNHFSFGSSFAMDDSVAYPGGWSSRRFEKSATYRAFSEQPNGSDEDAGDMTLGLFREQSAKPEPLFRKEIADALARDKKFNGPLPPIPPMPALIDSEEHLDMLAELTGPKLKPQRSGYSLRHQRSNSTPVHSRQISIVSYNDSDRWSTGSSIFPTWAKHFYAGDVALASLSHISLFVPSPPTRDGAQNGMRFERYPSERIRRSMSSRPQTSLSEEESRSPGSYKMLPAIFRPRTRQLKIKNGVARPVDDLSSPMTSPAGTPRSGSLAIEPVSSHNDSILPSEHPKYGVLKEESAQAQTGIHGNSATHSRATSKHKLTGPNTPPHLAPTKRSSAQLDTWRPPSFVESIDLIFKSRGHRQILYFFLGFFCPLVWMVAAFLPLPDRPAGIFDVEKSAAKEADSAVMPQTSSDAAVAWRKEKDWRQGVWWRNVNRVMSVVGLFVIAAVIAIAIVATR